MNPLEKDSFTHFKFLSNPQLSFDGNSVAYLLQWADMENNNYRKAICIYENGTETLLKEIPGLTGFSWLSSNEVVLSMLKTAENGKCLGTELFSMDRNGEMKSLGDLPYAGLSLVKAEAGRCLLRGSVSIKQQTEDTTDTVQGGESSDLPYIVFDEVPFWRDGAGITNGMRSQAFLFDLTSKEWNRLAPPTYQIDCLEISGDRVIFSGYDKADGQERSTAEVCIYDILTGITSRVLPEQSIDISYLGFWNDRVVMIAADGTIPGLKLDPSFYLLDLQGEKYTLFAKYDHAIGTRYTSVMTDARLGNGGGCKPDGNYVYFLTIINNGTCVRRVDREGHFSEPLTPYGSCDSFDVRNGRLVYNGLYSMKLPELYENGIQLTHYNDEMLSHFSISVPEEYSFLDHDGYEIFGWCIKPVGYREGVKYPALLNIHGGPRTVYGPVFNFEMQMFANKGYFVFFCNPRGSDGRGDEFADIYGHYGENDYLDLMEFTDVTLERYPDIDKEKVGVTGGSYGGFMTNWVVGHTDRFRAASSQRSISNWIDGEFLSDMGSTYHVNQIRASVFDNLDKVWKQSPLCYAKNVKTPILLMNSDKDYRCWYPDALQFFAAIRSNGVPSRFCLFPDESHDLSRAGRPKSRIARLAELEKWFDHYLKDKGERQ